MVQVLAIKCQCSGKTVGKGRGRLPSENGLDACEIRIVIPDVDGLSIIRIFADDIFSAAIHADQQLGQVVNFDGLVPTEIEDLAIRPGVFGGQQKSFDRIVDVGKVPDLIASPDLKGFSFDYEADPDTNESLSRVFDAHSWTDCVGQP